MNGVALLRDLSLNGVSAVLLDRDDFCSGASSASSRMAHGGLRYLEGREFRLVSESVRERNELVRNARHFVQPLEIIVPVRQTLRGFGRAILRFLGVSQIRGPLSLVALKGALTLYESLGRANRALPQHRVQLRRAEFPGGLAPETRAVVRYFDALIREPEGLMMEMLSEAVSANPKVSALNHVNWVQDADGFTVVDKYSAQSARLRPRMIVNAAGAWIDQVNAQLGAATSFVRGVKGAHLLIRNAALSDRMAGCAYYFDDGTGRMVITVPVRGDILVGTSEIDTSDPDDTQVSDDEVSYLLGAINGLFSDVSIDATQIVATTTGIRPLRNGDGTANSAARDHSIERADTDVYPVLCLVGGKWTTFRAFAETAADEVFRVLGRQRDVSTAGRAYPGALPCTLQDIRSAGAPDDTRAARLYARYGAIACEVAAFCAADSDTALRASPAHTRREIEWLIFARGACTIGDLTHHRTSLAFDVGESAELEHELAGVLEQFLKKPVSTAAAQDVATEVGVT